MEIFQIVSLGIVATIIILVLRIQRPEMAVQVGIITGLSIFFLIVGKLSSIVYLLMDYADRVDIDVSYFTILLKIIGIAYICEFGTEVCRDAGESAIASKIELAGKVVIAVIALPIITSLLEFIIKIMP